MGAYCATYVYVGRLLSQDAYERLLAAVATIGVDVGAWTTSLNDPRGRYILHAPGACLRVGSIDPVLEEHEVARGAVAKTELARVLPTDALDVLNAATSDPAISARLRTMVRAASPDGLDDAHGTYILQQWSSRVTHNIRVVDVPF